MSDPRIDEILHKVKSFPSVPGAGAKLLALLEGPDPDVEKIEDVLRYDPGLTANVLKLANSAYFGIPSKVGSVKQAVILLGLKRLIQLVIASCVSAIIDKPIAGYDLPPGNLWRHSIAVSIAAEVLVKDKKNLQIEDIFTPALLHDVGKLVLGHFVKDEFSDITDIASKGVPFVVAENMVLGTDHADIGARILTQWSFPPEVIQSVRRHHDPEACDGDSVQADVINLANLICHNNGTTAEDDGQAIEFSPMVMDRLGIQFSEFETISAKVAQWVDELAAALTFQ